MQKKKQKAEVIILYFLSFKILICPQFSFGIFVNYELWLLHYDSLLLLKYYDLNRIAI